MSFSVGLVSDGPHQSTVEQSGRIVSRYQRVYQYKTTAAARPTEASILTDVAITPGSPYPNDAHASCVSVEVGPGPERTRPPKLCYHVKVEWATTRTQWTLGSTIQSTYIVEDRHGKMIVNAAGQPFDGGIPVDQRFGKATATRCVDAAGYDQNAIVAMSGKLNLYTFLGGAPGTVQVDVEASEKYEGDYHFWEERYTFQHKPTGWQPRPMNAGFFQRTDDVVYDCSFLFIAVADDDSPTGYAWELSTHDCANPPTIAEVIAANAALEPEVPPRTSGGFPLSYDVTYEGTQADTAQCLTRIINSDLAGDCAAGNDPTAPVQEPEPLLPNGKLVPIADRPELCNFVDVEFFESFDFNTLGL